MKSIIKRIAAVSIAVVMATSGAVTASAATGTCNHSNKVHMGSKSECSQTYYHDPHLHGASQQCRIDVYLDFDYYYCGQCSKIILEIGKHEVHSISH